MTKQKDNNVISLADRRKPDGPAYSFTINPMCDEARRARERKPQALSRDEKIAAAMQAHGSHVGEANRKKVPEPIGGDWADLFGDDDDAV